MANTPNNPVQRALGLVRIDFRPTARHPQASRWAVGLVVALVGSILADFVIAKVATHVWPHLASYAHFQFSDYAKLTAIGVVGACVGWPVVTLISSAPRWVYLRAAILVTLVLWLPDLYILHQGQPAKAVAALMVMHLAIAVVTYVSMVYLAPTRPIPATRRSTSHSDR